MFLTDSRSIKIEGIKFADGKSSKFPEIRLSSRLAAVRPNSLLFCENTVNAGEIAEKYHHLQRLKVKGDFRKIQVS